MLLNSVILVLREILEAALLISVLLVFSRLADLGVRWTAPALATGFGGAVLYALNISTVSEWFDYAGQEVVNASLQLGIYTLLLAMAGLMRTNRSEGTLRIVMSLMVAAAIAREGSEILIYAGGLFSDPALVFPVLFGGSLGAGIGISTGALLYYALVSIEPPRIDYLLLPLLALFGANMVSQALGLLIQVDWLPSAKPVWDTSPWLPESSLLGQLLYALIGYEASPTGLQAGAYFASFTLLLGLLAYGRQTHLAEKVTPSC